MPEPIEQRPPSVLSWNVTSRCDLRCAHCYLGAGGTAAARGDLDTDACLGVVDEIAQLNPGMLLILTGGEPLLRRDLEQIATRASTAGLIVVVGTNGRLLTPERAKRLADAGVAGVGVSLDSHVAGVHDRLRGVAGCWQTAIEGMRAARASGLHLLVQTTVHTANRADLAAVAALAEGEGARAFNVYFLVCTGRARGFTDLSPEEYITACTDVRALEREYAGRMVVSPKCAPHYRRVVAELEDAAPIRSFSSGCPAGTDYLRIGPRGEITPCPYLPLEIGRIGEGSLKDAWYGAQVLDQLRKRENLQGSCGECGFRDACGGCRARAYSATENISAEDPTCMFLPRVGNRGPVAVPEPTYGLPDKATMPWTVEAEQRLTRVPSMLRGMVVKRVEQAAREAGEDTVTPERMQAVRARSSNGPARPPRSILGWLKRSRKE